MRLGIMQPYFFPYLGYFSLIKHADLFILFDTPQFIRHGWIERNRILKPDVGWMYVSVPLIKHELQTPIKDVKIDNSQDWRHKLLAMLTHYKKRAPYYAQTLSVLESVLDVNTDSIVALNKAALEAVCRYLGINTQIAVFSEMALEIEPVEAPDEWALNICRALGADEYWNPPGGEAFFDPEKYARNKVKLLFHRQTLSFYSQRRGQDNFEPGLSILDVMMFNSPEAINQMLLDFELNS